MVKSKKSKRKAVKKKTLTPKTQNPTPKTKKPSKPLFLGLAIALIVVTGILYLTCDPVVEAGDFVTVQYVGRFENGSVFDSGNLSFTAGAGELITGFGEGVLGIREGAQKALVIPPEDGYGKYDISLVFTMKRESTMNRTILSNTSLLAEFVDGEIAVGDKIDIRGYYWPFIVTKVGAANVTIKHNPKVGKTYTTIGFTPWDWKATNLTNETFTVKAVNIELGSALISYGARGKLISFDDENMVIDSNHQLAGKTLLFDVKVIEIVKEEDLK